MNTLRIALLSTPFLFAACATTAPFDPYAGADETDLDDSAADSPSSRLVSGFTQTDLVSDRDGAVTKDPSLVNPWGIAFNPAGPAWIANNHTGTSTVYDDAGALKLTVTLPAMAAPTGQVFNASTTDFGGDKFIFDGEDGRIYGWKPSGVTVRGDNSAAHAIYKGLAIATDDNGHQRLYLTDFHNAKVTVLDASYNPITVPGGFFDARIPAGYAPFNAQALEGKIFVTFAKQGVDAVDDDHGRGRGYVDQFDTDGHLERRLVTRGSLNSPWALAIAPSTWGSLAGTLLVGNFGNGRVHAYDIHATDSYGQEKVVAKGTLAVGASALSIDGLWALAVSPDNELYFTAGSNDEENGLFGLLAR